MLGNSHIRGILDTYISTIQRTGIIPVPFVLFVGPVGLGKFAFAEQLAQRLTGEWYRQDVLRMIDCSRDIEKSHTIKISSDEEITRIDGSIYEDFGIREVNQRLVKSPGGIYKILVIEDMERMTESAANGLLKMLEEPLPGRLILATCSQPQAILPTIVSRALICLFYPSNDTDIQQYIAQNPLFSQYNTNRLTALAAGRPGVLQELSLQIDGLDLLQKGFDILAQKNSSITEKYKALIALQKNGLEKIFLQAYIYRAATQNDRDAVRLTQQTYALTDYAINTDHILFDFVMSYHAASHA